MYCIIVLLVFLLYIFFCFQDRHDTYTHIEREDRQSDEGNKKRSWANNLWNEQTNKSILKLIHKASVIYYFKTEQTKINK